MRTPYEVPGRTARREGLHGIGRPAGLAQALLLPRTVCASKNCQFRAAKKKRGWGCKVAMAETTRRPFHASAAGRRAGGLALAPLGSAPGPCPAAAAGEQRPAPRCGLRSVSTPPRSYIGARSCGGQLWFPDNAVVSVEDAHFQSQPCICFSCGRSF